MLSISKVGTGTAAASYYEGADNYYMDGRPPCSWWGAGAAQMGVKGEVHADLFRSLLDGRLPNGQVLHNAADGRRGGTDLTLSAPKSVSLQALVGGDRRLIQAHERAVNSVLTYAQHLAAYRVTENGLTRTDKSEALVVATFRHDLSRGEEPQLHTHAVVINATPRPDGAWRALEQSEFYRQQKLMGVIYRSELALQVKALGYEVRRTHGDGRFELAHFNDAQIQAFSSRSRAIETELEKQGKTRADATAREKEVIALATRSSKSGVDRDALRQRWQERSRELGIDFYAEREAITEPAHTLQERARAASDALKFAVEHTTERQSIVTEPELLRAALEQGTGATDLESIRGALSAAVARGELIEGEGRYTTPLAQDLEKDLLASELRGRGALIPIMNVGTVRQALTSTGLNDGQRAAVEMVLTGDSRITAVQGSAGTGKTMMLSEARELAETQGYRMIGLAPSAAAARELRNAGIESQTVAAFKHRHKDLSTRSILVVDEAGMIPTRDMYEVVTAAEVAQARVLLVGDVQQLKAIQAGKPFAQLQAAGMTRVEMTEIQRQRDGQLRIAVEYAAQGNVTNSLRLLEDRIIEIRYAQARYQAVAQEFAQLGPEQREHTLVVAGTRAARAAINEYVREELGLTGQGITITTLERKDLTQPQARSAIHFRSGDRVQVSNGYETLMPGEMATVVGTSDERVILLRECGEQVDWRPAMQPASIAYEVHSRELAVGDVVRFTANDYVRNLLNGDRAVIAQIDEARSAVTLLRSDGSTIELDARSPLTIEHAYCTTVHSSQGQTCERVIIEADTRSATSNESSYYVAISRARESATIFTDDREMLPESMSRACEKTAALDLKRDAGVEFA